MKLKSILYICFFLFFVFSIQAQQGKSDVTFNTFDDGLAGEGFDGNVRVVIENPDETLFVAGDFLNFNGSSATRIIKLTVDGERDASFMAGTGFNGSVVAGFATLGGKWLYGGSFTNYNGTAQNYLARLNTDGSLDTAFNSGNVGPNAVVQAITQFSDGSILVAGDAITSYNGTAVNNVFKIAADGALDTAFNAKVTAGTAGAISKVMVQTDGKILVGGSFTSFNGASTRGLVRLNMDGTLDTAFGANLGTGANGNILAVDVQPNGKIILGGAFTSFNGTAVGRIIRLNADGTRDSTFNNGLTGFANGIVQAILSTTEGIYVGGSFSGNYNGAGPSLNRFVLLQNNGNVDPGFDTVTSLPSSTFYTIVKAQDGQVFIGGSFTSYDLTTRGRLAKIDRNGDLDTSFLSSGGVGANNSVLKVIPLATGKTMIFGLFLSFNGVTVNRIARLNTDGSLDTTFNATGSGASNTIRTAIQLSDGSFIVGGNFATYNGTSRDRILKINADGTLNNSFNTGNVLNLNGAVYTIVQDANGKFLVGGSFTSVAGLTRNRLIRLHSDGTLDSGFIANANGIIETIVIEPISNKIIVGGQFTTFNGTAVTRLVRIDTAGNLDLTFNNNNGPSDTVYTLAFQSGGRLLVGGNFANYGGVPKRRFLRLAADGAIDTTFKSGIAFSNSNVRSLLVQPDDRIVIGGTFSGMFAGDDAVAHQVRRIVRLKSDGSYDSTFKTVLNSTCFTSAIDLEGRIMIGGTFNSVNGTAKHRVARLLACVDQSTRNSSGWTRGIPDKKFEVTVEEDLTLSADTHWCNCSVATGKQLVVEAGKALTLAFDVWGNATTHSGKIQFLNTASLLQQDASSSNTGIIEYHRISAPMENFDYTYWSSPVAGQTAKNLSPNTLADKYYRYIGTTGWFFDDGEMKPGVGYIIRTPKPGVYGAPNPETVVMPYSQPVAFKGVPNNGEVPFLAGSDEFNLVGNPYPSALDATKFIQGNSGIIYGPLYFWTHNTPISNGAYTSDDYATYNYTGSTATAVGNFVDANNNGIKDPAEEVISNRPSGYIAAGQSFFVGSQTVPTATKFVFTNAMRESSNNDEFFKQANTKKTASTEKNRIWLNLTNSGGSFKQLLVGYVEGATNDWDNLYDGPSFDGQTFIDFYSVNQGKNLTIQGRALPFEVTDVVPLGYRIHFTKKEEFFPLIAGTFEISIDSRDGQLASQEIWLEDKKNNTLHDLTKGSYTFSTINTTTEKDIIENDRFVLQYANKTLATEDSKWKDKTLVISVKNKKITLTSSEESIIQVQIFDILGRKIYDASQIDAKEWAISSLKSSNQVLIVKTTLTNGASNSEKIVF